MTLATMIYGLIVAVLVGGAAWFLDRGLRAVGRPTRWIWIGALGVGGLAPLFPRFLPAVASEDGPGPLATPVRALYELGTPVPPLPEQSGSYLTGIGVESSLGALWILGSVLVLLLFALLCLRLRRLRATWETQDVCGEEVLRSDRFGPAVVGLIRSRIVLPSWTLGLGERELQMVVLHEREHVQARDPALLAAGLLLASLSPWNPAVWWSLARLRLAVEGDCDRRVLARGTSARSYARLLLTVAAGCRRTPDPVPALVRGGHSVIERRLMMISNATRKPRIRASILAAVAGLGLFALACDTPIPQGLDERERPVRSEALVGPPAVVEEAPPGPKAGVGYEGEVGYVDEDGVYRVVDLELEWDEDGTFRMADPEVDARLRRMLEVLQSSSPGLDRNSQELRTTLEAAAEARRRQVMGAMTEEKIPTMEGLGRRPEELIRRVETAETRGLWLRLGNVSGSIDVEGIATPLAMEVRRLATAVEAGEITHDEAARILRDRLDLPDSPR